MTLTQKANDLSGRKGAPLRHDITMEEVSQHNTEFDAWTVLDGRVYNMTPYLLYHPGGKAQLMLGAGGDCTDLFNENHAWVNGHSMLEKCLLGYLAESQEDAPPSSRNSKFAIDPAAWQSFPLETIQPVSKMTKLFRFRLPKGKTLGLERIGQHILLRAKMGDKVIERQYTPVSTLNETGHFDLVIKLYPNGAMSKYLASLAAGDQVEMLGPRGSFGYTNPGEFYVGNVQRLVSKVGMVAGGSGITPMLQLIRAIFDNPKDQTQVWLIFCNHSVEHIIARQQLEELERNFPQRFRLHHVIKLEEGTDALDSCSIGRISVQTLHDHLPPPRDDTMIIHSGPIEFDAFLTSSLIELRYSAAQRHEM